MAENKRSSNVKNNFKLDSPGPYMARVVNNIDPEKMGALEVELLRTVGNTSSTEQQLFTVRYCSPFYGVTDVFHNTPNTNYDYNETQKSYGFWMVPPDTGTIVMVMFVEGWAGEGYWFGCIPDKNMNYMVPGIAGSTSLGNTTRIQDVDGWTGTRAQAGRGGGDRVNPGGGEVDISTVFQNADILPVAEYNKVPFREGETFNEDVDANIKPVHPIAYNILEQGLIRDPVRGVHTSSSRRETPSNVFGISTPGPIDKRPGAQKGQVGKRDKVVTKFVSRLGGTTLVMDDGNEKRLRKYRPYEGPMEYADLEKNEDGGIVDLPEDEGFRIRTRTGHQILMSNTEDLIYINNSRGTAWIELTSNGKIDIFAQDSVSIHTENDLNLTADRDINFTAGGNINVNAITDFKRTVGGSEYSAVGGNKVAEVGGNNNIKVVGNEHRAAGQGIALKADNKNIEMLANNGSLVSQASFEISSTCNGAFSILTNGQGTIRCQAPLNMVASTISQASYLGPIQLDAKKDVTFKTEGDFYHEFTGNFYIKAANIAFDADKIDFNSGVASEAVGKLNNFEVADVYPTAPYRFNTASPSTYNTERPVMSAVTNVVESPVTGRVPQHEPWLQHENLNPQVYTPEYTRAGLKQYDSYGPHITDLLPPGAAAGGAGYGSGDPRGTRSVPRPGSSSSGGGDPGGGGSGTSNDGDDEVASRTSAGGTGLTPNAKKLMDIFINEGGMTVAQAAGFVGSMQSEGYWRKGVPWECEGGAPCPKAFLKPRAQDGFGEGARGIAQWRGPRIKEFRALYGKDILEASLEEQADYVLREIGNNKKYSGRGLDPQASQWWGAVGGNEQNTADVAELYAASQEAHYERSDRPMPAARKSQARMLFQEYTAEADPSENVPDGSGEPRATGAGSYFEELGTGTGDRRPSQEGEQDPEAIPSTNEVSSQNLVTYQFSGRLRPNKVAAGLEAIMAQAAQKAGLSQRPGWTLTIFAGTTEESLRSEDSSQRHWYGSAADFYINDGNGRRVSYNEEPNLWDDLIVNLYDNGIRAFGFGPGYMEGAGYGNADPLANMHIDVYGQGLPGSWNGELIVWGDNGKVQGPVKNPMEEHIPQLIDQVFGTNN
jgi:hypothetical protein